MKTILFFCLFFFLGSAVHAQEIPRKFIGTYTDSKAGCPKDDGYLIVSRREYRTYMKRNNGDQTVIDEHICTLNRISGEIRGGRNINFSCVSIFQDLASTRFEVVDENWRMNSNGEIVIDETYIYRPCN